MAGMLNGMLPTNHLSQPHMAEGQELVLGQLPIKRKHHNCNIMIKSSVFIFLLLSIMNMSCAAQLQPLYKYPDAIINKTNNSILIEKFNLREDADGTIYHYDTLIFKPEGDYKYCIYEIYKNYLIITPISEANLHSSYIYMLPKRKIKFYNLITKEWVDTDLKGNFLVEINEKERHITIKTDKNTNEKIPY